MRASTSGAVARPTNELRRALNAFNERDWTFASAKTATGLHGIHPYPAKFIPQIPGTLLDLFHPLVRGPVLDPFCGSGTTLLECQRRGIESVGIDLNPIATLVSFVKTHPPAQALRPVARMLVERARKERDPPSVAIPRVSHWFTDGAAEALTRLTHTMQNIEDPTLSAALRVALSRIIVRISRQESDTRYAAVESRASAEDVYAAFVDSSQALDSSFEAELSNLFRRPAPVTVHTKDLLDVAPRLFTKRFGMVVTSPPYPNAYEYWLYHKYRMYWLGEDPIAVRDKEIGARPNYFKRNPATPDDFLAQMKQCFQLFFQVTRPGAFVCILVGRSIIRGEVIDNAELLRMAADSARFSLLAAARRSIPATRKAFNPVHGSINEETLLVFGRDKE